MKSRRGDFFQQNDVPGPGSYKTNLKSNLPSGK